jgi:hypothetical protein
MNKNEMRVGQKVTPIQDERVPLETVGRVFTVEKLNPKKVRCSADDGDRGINFPYELLAEATEENLNAGPATRPFDPDAFFTVGEVVTMKTDWKDVTTETPLVVIGDSGKRVKVTRLGGDGDRYVRCGREALVKRDLEWLAGALLETV